MPAPAPESTLSYPEEAGAVAVVTGGPRKEQLRLGLTGGRGICLGHGPLPLSPLSSTLVEPAEQSHSAEPGSFSSPIRSQIQALSDHPSLIPFYQYVRMAFRSLLCLRAAQHDIIDDKKRSYKVRGPPLVWPAVLPAPLLFPSLGLGCSPSRHDLRSGAHRAEQSL